MWVSLLAGFLFAAACPASVVCKHVLAWGKDGQAMAPFVAHDAVTQRFLQGPRSNLYRVLSGDRAPFVLQVWSRPVAQLERERLELLRAARARTLSGFHVPESHVLAPNVLQLTNFNGALLRLVLALPNREVTQRLHGLFRWRRESLVHGLTEAGAERVELTGTLLTLFSAGSSDAVVLGPDNVFVQLPEETMTLFPAP
jgi:hypothetical protein